MSNGISYKAIKSELRKQNKEYGIVNESVKTIVERSTKSYDGLNNYISSWPVLEISDVQAIRNIANAILEISENELLTESVAKRLTKNVIVFIIKESSKHEDIISTINNDIKLVHPEGSIQETFNGIMDELLEETYKLKKYTSIVRNINKLNSSIKLETMVKHNLNIRNKESDIEEFIYELCTKIYNKYPSVSDIVKYGIMIESLKMVFEEYHYEISESSILENVTRFYAMNEEVRSNIPMISLHRAVMASSVYSESSKEYTLEFIEEMVTESEVHGMLESKLSAKQRKELPDSMFGLPKQRKYPLVDEQHVNSAKTYFNKCSEKDKPTLAKNILKRSKELKMEINKDSEWYSYVGKNVKEGFTGLYSESFADVPVVLEASDRDSIRQIGDKILASGKKSVSIAKKFLSKVYAKPMYDIVDNIPTILDILRRIILVGGFFAINPYLGIVVGLVDHLIHQIVNLDHCEKLERQLDKEIKKMERKRERDITDEEKANIGIYITTLEKQKYKVSNYKESLISSIEMDKVEEMSNNIDICEEMAAIMAISEAFDEMMPIEEISTAKVVSKRIDNKAKKGARKVAATDRRLSKSLDQRVDKLKDKIAKSVKNDRREAIIKGQIIPSTSKIVKSALAVGAVGMVSPVLAAIGALAGIAISKKSNAKERKLILDEIEIELEMTDKRLQQAEMNNDMKAYEELLRIKKKLQYEKKRIQYKQKTGANL